MDGVAELPFERRSLIRLDPRTKMFLAFTVSTIMISGDTGGIMQIIRPCLAAFSICLLVLSKKWKAVVQFAITYSVLFALELTVLPMLSGTKNFLLGAVIGIYTHMLPGFIMGYYLIDTTTVSEFVAAMEKMHISPKIVIPISVVFRFFPTVKEEYVSINDAMRIRGITALCSPLKMLEYRIVPLMISVAKIGEELSAAALTRGLGSPIKRTNICTIGLGALDIIFILFALICWIFFAV